ncbi:MAG: heat-inducible transcriptional repressor HrcA, partial [Halanaerobiales bacterium]
MVRKLENRKREILKAIIREHILTAEPIGSRTLAKTYDFGVSSATIRNEMADLEDMGFLKQPHTSAGRVPTDKGYRYYVDVLMEQEISRLPDLQNSLSRFQKDKKGMQGIISGMTNILSRLTKYTTLISEPELQKSKIKKLEIIKVSQKSLLVVLITDSGIVNNKILNLDQEIDSRQLDYINNFLSERLAEKKLTALDQKFFQQLENELMQKINISQKIFSVLAEEMEGIITPADFRIFLGGTSYILEQPEFSDLQTLKKVLNILDHEDNLRQLIQNLPDEDIEVKIGEENSIEAMKRCSIVYATYHLGDKAVGKIGIIGPTRMQYHRVISTVDFAADILGEIISQA